MLHVVDQEDCPDSTGRRNRCVTVESCHHQLTPLARFNIDKKQCLRSWDAGQKWVPKPLSIALIGS